MLKEKVLKNLNITTEFLPHHARDPRRMVCPQKYMQFQKTITLLTRDLSSPIKGYFARAQLGCERDDHN